MNTCVFIIFSFLLLCFETTTANKCFDEERQALLDFKAHLQDPNGSLSTWRTEEDDCCKWVGVGCNNQTGHVIELQLRGSGLGGEINHSLLNLSYLYSLDLSDNGFNGTIPRSIGSLTELRYLGLSDNSFYGTIPPEFGNLTNLQELDLVHVGKCKVENLRWLSHLSLLEGLEMDGISLAKANHWVNIILSLRELSYLSLEGCELSEVVYPYSSFLNSSSSSIVSLDLSYNNLTSSMYRWLFPLISNTLTLLDLSSNKLDGIPKYLGNLCSLERLYFHNNSAVVKFPEFLNNLSGCASLTLQVLNAPRSQFTGSMSYDIQKFSSLESLDLSDNDLNGTVSDKLWELPRLEILDISFNHLKGAISENIGKSNATFINLSNNTLEGVSSTDHMSNLSYVESINLSFCKLLGPHFPKWIQKLKNLTHLDISNTGITDTIPLDFWNTWPSQLEHLNLSSNNFSGNVPDLSTNFNSHSVIDLSSNNFHGPIPNVSSSLKSLDLSRNKFSGGISFLCKMVDGFLGFLDLSHNFLTGQIPDCLWHFEGLRVLNLGHNNLSGRLPPSIGYLIDLEVLYLYKNHFSGELPLSLKNCTGLYSLNLGANKFSGNVPDWIGENLSELYVLILRSNNLSGTIPLQLCRLPNLQVLDFSVNNLHGTIPSCLNNLTSMVQESSQKPKVLYTSTAFSFAEYADHAVIGWLGDEREFLKSNMGLLKTIDLSSNNLTGQIPYELTNLYGLVALNLSKNTLLGEIPRQIGEMKNLLALDLSENNLSGGIPSSMSQMTLLGYLDVSSNHLSGRIPTSTQLQSFEPSRYDGNARLCGPPLTKKCPGDEDSKLPPIVGESEADGEGQDEFEGWFYIGGGTGFVTGFWIACGALILNRRGRHAFYHFYDSFRDWVYVKVVVFIAKFRRFAHT